MPRAGRDSPTDLESAATWRRRRRYRLDPPAQKTRLIQVLDHLILSQSSRSNQKRENVLISDTSIMGLKQLILERSFELQTLRS